MRRIPSKLEQDQEKVLQATEDLKSEPVSFVPDARQVLELVANAYGVTTEDILGHTRVSLVIRPRQVLMYLLHAGLGMSYVKIGEFLGRDHTTVMHSCRKILEAQVTNAVLAKEILQFQKALAAMRSPT